MKRVAITGLGAVTPLGNSVDATWKSLVAGRSGIGRLTTFRCDEYPVRIAGLVKDFDVMPYLPNPRFGRYLSRSACFGVGAFLQAMEDAQVEPATYLPYERGISVGSGGERPDIRAISSMYYLIHETGGEQFPRYAPGDAVATSHNVGPATMALIGGFQGPMISVNMACTSSTCAIGEAFRRIQDGEVKLMAAGGYDSMTDVVDVLGFSLLGALTTQSNDTPERASRPFDRERSGFVLGEGGVLFILEDWDSAIARGAHIYAEILGYGSSMNAYRITDSPPDGDGPIQAIRQALHESGLGTGEIDYIVAHGTSTPGNDVSETAAIKHVFGDDAYRLAISAPKSMTGHLTAGAGALNLLAAVCALRDQVVPPTINYEHPDPKLDLDYTPNQARPRTIRAAMVNSFAFGGTNAVLVVRAPTSTDYHRHTQEGQA